MAVGFGIQSLKIAEQVRKTLFNEHKADQLLCLTFKSSQVNEKNFSLGDGNIILFPYAINCASFYFSNIFYFICRNLCPNGTYSLGAQIKCTICLPGSKCPSITEGPTICPPGYFSETNAAECKLCEAGKQCADPACEFLFFFIY